MIRTAFHLFLLTCLSGGGLNGAETGLPATDDKPVSVKDRVGPLPKIYSSASHQFFVIGHPPGAPKGPPPLSQIRVDHLQMDPSVLAMACERVKQQLYKMLLLDDEWKSRISVVVDGPALPEQPIAITAIAGSRGLNYRVVLPGQVPKQRLVRAIVRALLLEVINREARGTLVTEVPLWLQEGLAAHLFATEGDILMQGITERVFGLNGSKIVTGARTRTTFDRTYEDSLVDTYRHLQLNQPIDFALLNLPNPGQLTGYEWKTYQHCAHLFVAELLRLPDGPEKLTALLRALPEFHNPQLALIKAFEPQFHSALAIEKWWSLVLVDFQGRDANLRWGENRALEHLNEILYAPVVIRANTNAVPVTREMHFQQLIRDTSFNRHKPILEQALKKLFVVQLNAHRDLARLINDYRLTIHEYISKRDAVDDAKGAATPNVIVAKKSTIDQLDLLDGIRFDYKLVASPEPARQMDLERVEKLINK